MLVGELVSADHRIFTYHASCVRSSWCLYFNINDVMVSAKTCLKKIGHLLLVNKWKSCPSSFSFDTCNSGKLSHGN
jgi:hypothetical protein